MRGSEWKYVENLSFEVQKDKRGFSEEDIGGKEFLRFEKKIIQGSRN